MEDLKPKAKAYEVTDPATPGLQLRIEPTGEKVWQWRFPLNGTRPKLTLDSFERMGLADARSAAVKARELRDRGIDPRRAQRTTTRPRVNSRDPLAPTASGDAHSIETLCREYLEIHIKVERKHKDPAYTERLLKAEVLSQWAGRDARSISSREVLAVLDRIVQRGALVMASKTARVLDQLFRYGIHRQIVERIPCSLMPPGGKEESRDRTLTDEETTIVLRNVDVFARYQTGLAGRSPRMAHIVRLQLICGQRIGEFARARWKDVTLTGSAPAWNIPKSNAKGAKRHVVPLSDAAVREFEALRKYAAGSDWVLPRVNRAGEIVAGHMEAKTITRAVARAKALRRARHRGKWTAHDLRRTMRSGLSALGIDETVAEHCINHVVPGVRGIYDRHKPVDRMADALQRWADHLATL